MTIYKTEGRIYVPKVVLHDKSSSEVTQSLQESHDYNENGCRDRDCPCQCDCNCNCDCEAQSGATVPMVNRRRARPCSVWALAAICTVTVGLCFLLAGLLYMATKPEFRSWGSRPTCMIVFPPEPATNMTQPETVEVDPEEQVETIDIPKFNGNHHLTIMSDFKIQMTAFRDNEDNRCFLLDHNNTLFESPSNLMEFMADYKNGKHLTRLDTVYAKMQVLSPEVDITMMSSSIQTHCFEISTFWLHTVETYETDAIAKRSSDNQFVAKRRYTFYNGKKVVHLALDQ